ncbi:DciA family protein [Aquisalimonas sp.]|uniref:DciA family protein n=1 Tax=unclassified Aquisalimonas TaxID=2644645 RepID=UPI0025BF5785|nr:DciA family protein [Aquisalimonas sp.]
MATKGKGPKPLSGAFKETRGPAAGLYARAAQLRQWETRLLRELPPQARGHVRLARIGRDALVLVADSPEWRHRLRYLAPRLQEVVMDQAGIRPQQVTIRIGNLPRRPDVTTPKTLSTSAGRTIDAAARHATDPRLADALAKLASRAPGGREQD